MKHFLMETKFSNLALDSANALVRVPLILKPFGPCREKKEIIKPNTPTEVSVIVYRVAKASSKPPVKVAIYFLV